MGAIGDRTGSESRLGTRGKDGRRELRRGSLT